MHRLGITAGQWRGRSFRDRSAMPRKAKLSESARNPSVIRRIHGCRTKLPQGGCRKFFNFFTAFCRGNVANAEGTVGPTQNGETARETSQEKKPALQTESIRRTRTASVDTFGGFAGKFWELNEFVKIVSGVSKRPKFRVGTDTKTGRARDADRTLEQCFRKRPIESEWTLPEIKITSSSRIDLLKFKRRFKCQANGSHSIHEDCSSSGCRILVCAAFLLLSSRARCTSRVRHCFKRLGCPLNCGNISCYIYGIVFFCRRPQTDFPSEQKRLGKLGRKTAASDSECWQRLLDKGKMLEEERIRFSGSSSRWVHIGTGSRAVPRFWAKIATPAFRAGKWSDIFRFCYGESKRESSRYEEIYQEEGGEHVRSPI